MRFLYDTTVFRIDANNSLQLVISYKTWFDQKWSHQLLLGGREEHHLYLLHWIKENSRYYRYDWEVFFQSKFWDFDKSKLIILNRDCTVEGNLLLFSRMLQMILSRTFMRIQQIQIMVKQVKCRFQHHLAILNQQDKSKFLIVRVTRKRSKIGRAWRF